ncbi:MerR family transcriptional regulator [Alkaliphilus peptidifermentans]|uniref:DNA-binding transcriptional regulator, MerR family n=1 Tax=Alkaliphilus peptidifermentans DSM 18978 TaxID=1120976 RepID=A0A1G5HC47_9FIRM|nr:MerR family transcriptional regulator [Alkaliphilus peptidifermentans]SCY61452.1 DNA-binding transcriptional regulator, MerR family [Alkaliphilus peptidifermentans DSM 18978]
MKIGTFSKQNNLTIDSIRHYMELSLILPEKQGGHYDFDDRCQRDLEDIFSLKDMGFTLNEIKTIFKYKRLGKLTHYKEDEYYVSLFTNKLDSLSRDIEILSRYKANIEVKLKDITSISKFENYRMGVNLKALDILCCHICSGHLILVDGSIDNNQIINGKLKCNCGEEYIIESGILCWCKEKLDKDFDYEEEYTKHLSEYIYLTDSTFIDNLNKGLEWTYKKIGLSSFRGKILLELGTGFGYFLRYIYNDLPDDCLYIAVDHNINKQRFLKSILEKSGCRKNIFFISSDFLKIPIRNKSIDILLDISGTSNYSFENSDFLLKLTDNYIKDNAYLIGSYILFKNFSRNSLIDECYRKNFHLENIKDSISKLKYKLIDESISDYIEKGGKYENYFVKGEKVFSYIYYGER